MLQDMPQADAKEAKLFWGKIWEWNNHIKMTQWINNKENELQGEEASPEEIKRL